MKGADWLSERMVFGLLIIGGYLGCMAALSAFKLPAPNLNLISQGVGSLGTAVGVIVAAIWKTDKTDKQAAESIASLSATVASQASPSPPLVNDPFVIKE